MQYIKIAMLETYSFTKYDYKAFALQLNYVGTKNFILEYFSISKILW